MSKYSLAALESEVNKVARATALNIVKGLTFSTPKDTGMAKGNWQTSANAPIMTTIDRLDLTGSQANTEAASVTESIKNIKYPEIWITNNLPYIGILNNGSSQQAPAKFVESVIKKVVNKLG